MVKKLLFIKRLHKKTEKTNDKCGENFCYTYN